MSQQAGAPRTAADPGGEAARLLPLLDDLMPRDAERLRTRIAALAAVTDPQRRALGFLRVVEAVSVAEDRLARRRAAVPTITYPDLPVSARRNDLLAALRADRVVVVAGETGSGKTTQLPKMLLETGRGVRGMVGHTQPRRIAARSVAERLAEELGVELGGAVGYSVRFTGQVSDTTLVRVMTDGVLLAEVHDDPRLLRYDAIVLDEAHERSLTIDMLLGYLARLLPQRPDLQVVVTSATIDPGRFAAHFAAALGLPAGGVPVVEVSGRTYPVEVRYRPWGPGTVAGGGDEDAGDLLALGEDDDRELPDAVADAVSELAREGPGDVLVFCSGEREIREVSDALARRSEDDRRLAGLAVVPLFARLTAAEQHAVFAPHTGRRAIVATNVAETSITVPGIRYVVDTGTARISRYSRRTKVQRLPVEPISQASARQRAGRCGRVADGVCVRLYSHADLESRPAFTEPEILRTNLAAVVLRMAALDLGAVEDFPFVDPPDRRAVRDAVALLEELQAVEPADPAGRGGPGGPGGPGGAGGVRGTAPQVTAVGRALSRLPVDPRLGRMLVEAERTGCLDEVVVLAAALSIIDPRERPRDDPGPADAAHRRFADPDSDFLGWLALWRYLESARAALSGSALRRRCRAEHLNFRRVREWWDLAAQLRQTARELGWSPSSVGLAEPARSGEPSTLPGGSPAGDAADRVHRAALSGLLSHVGLRLDEPARAGSADRRGPAGAARARSGSEEYQGARGARFRIAPGSGLGRRRPRWVMAAELVETSQVLARTAAGVQPPWVEAAAGDLAVRTYSEPRWDRRRAQVLATERVTVYGLPVVTGRAADYARVDPAIARDLFVRHALVHGEWGAPHAFLAANREVLAEAERVEERTRRRDAVVGEEDLVAFFAARLPADVVSARTFDRWWRSARRATPDLLTLDLDTVVRRGRGPAADAFPDVWRDPGTGGAFPLSYRFAPGGPDDGVSVDVALAQFAGVDLHALEWLVPGLREELVAELIRTLPKALRRSFAPAATHAGAVLAAVARDDGGPPAGRLVDVVARELTGLGGTVVTADDLDAARLPAHLRMRVRVVEADGSLVAAGRDPATLRAELGARQRAAVADLAGDLERQGLREWSGGPLPEEVTVPGPAGPVTAYPALVAEAGGTVGVRVLPSRAEADRALPGGVLTLLLLTVPSPVRELVAALPTPAKLALAAPPGTDTAGLLADVVRAAVADLAGRWAAVHGWPRTPEAFGELAASVRTGVRDTAREVLDLAVRVSSAAGEAHGELAAAEAAGRVRADPALADGLADERAHLAALLGPTWVSVTGRERLPHLLRYITAARRRVAALVEDPRRDAARLARWREAADDVARAAGRSGAAALRWQLEEFRVALFAQSLGTAHPVSEQRIRRAVDALPRL
ncbi:MAG: ATP-dependent RNA helicase HrpA [Kineosporiaceae bacterium]